jgi:hypothetical protein
MGFITLGIETATGIEPERRKTSLGVRVYLWSCVLAVFVFLVVAYLGFALQYPPGRAVLFGEWGTTTALSAGSLALGRSKLREHTTTWVSWAVGLFLGAIVTIEFAWSVIALMSLAMAH